MNTVKKGIYNLLREYTKGYLTGNLGKVVEEEDRLICYVKQHKFKKTYLSKDFICPGISEKDMKLADSYKLNKPVVYIIDGFKITDESVMIYGYDNCEVIINNCRFDRGLIVNVAGKCTLENNQIKKAYKWQYFFANELTLKNTFIDNYYYLASVDMSISLDANDSITIIDSKLGIENHRTSVNLNAQNKIVIINSTVAGDSIKCSSPRIATYENTSLSASKQVEIDADSFMPLKVTAPHITVNGSELASKNQSVILEKITDTLSLKRLELIELLKELSKKCNKIVEHKISSYTEKVNNNTIAKTLTKKVGGIR